MKATKIKHRSQLPDPQSGLKISLSFETFRKA